MDAPRSTEGALLRRLLPAGAATTSDPVAALAPDARPTLLDWYRLDSPAWLRLTLVSTLDGRAAGSDGTSETLTSRVDRTILGVIRELSDVVLVGAQTLRQEPRLVPRHRPLIVLSASGNLGPARVDRVLGASPTPPLLVATTTAGAAQLAHARPDAEPIIIEPEPSGRLSLPRVVDALHDRGLHRISAEGGPQVASALLAAGLVDELCLTLMPVMGGAALPLLGTDAAVLSPLRLVQLLADDAGALYGRWVTR